MCWLHGLFVAFLGVSIFISGCEKSGEEYTKSAIFLSDAEYDQIMHDSDSLKGKTLTCTAKVVLARGSEDDLELLLLAPYDTSKLMLDDIYERCPKRDKVPRENLTWATYTKKYKEERILEGDYITIWGELIKVGKHRKGGHGSPEIDMPEMRVKLIKRCGWTLVNGSDIWEGSNGDVTIKYSRIDIRVKTPVANGTLIQKKQNSIVIEKDVQGTFADDGVAQLESANKEFNASVRIVDKDTLILEIPNEDGGAIPGYYTLNRTNRE